MKTEACVCVSRFKPAAILHVGGEDALSFLQGQFTQELRGMKSGETRYGLWLNQKGRALADSVIWGGAGGYFLMSYFSPAAELRTRLEAYVIADDVVIEDRSAGWEGWAVVGVGAGAWVAGRAGLAVAPPAGSCVESGSGDGWIVAGRRDGGESWDWIFPAGTRQEILDTVEISAVELEARRIAAGIPGVPQDVGPGDLPNEGGLEREGISYTKGCYLGQEVMARLKSMGQVRRRIAKVSGPGDAPVALPVALFCGGKKVGEVRSAVRAGGGSAGGWVGLAMIATSAMGDGCELGFTAEGPWTVRAVVAERFPHE